MQCRVCLAEAPESSRFCPSCGTALVESSVAVTVAGAQGVKAAGAAVVVRPPSTQSLDRARFVPGTMLASRYRIVALLGRGGMGEVYRAEDLTLGQLVALKFLPPDVARDPDRLARFHQEVRLARQVSHPNVCRVYDIGDADGYPFISMEFVDGEDLASLMRRIGRLPVAKATELGRQVCAGLAAAHDRGVLHRDLKPANVMIDGRGRARIADFGLAGAVDDRKDGAAIMGTPGYMAPEQFAGQGTSTRSDVYALGLVLYELFTGKPAIVIDEVDPIKRLAALSNPADPARPASIALDLDPAIERVILRCLERDPARRPPSALAVASALPGGDPLAAALAAGETPSPEMVAAAGESDAISLRTIGLCVASIIAGLVIASVARARTNPLQETPFEQPPAALEQKARELIRSFGYTDPPTDRAYGLDLQTEFREWAARQEPRATLDAQLAQGQPAPIVFWYRQSPQYLDVVNGVGAVTKTNPPMTTSGMIRVSLDTQGRLVQLDAVPPQVDQSPAASPPPANWPPLLAAAGLDMARFTPAESTWAPLAPFDAHAAWTGSFAHAPDVPMRVEAASWRGKPVYFQVIGPWTRPARMDPFALTPGRRLVQAVVQLMMAMVCGVAMLLAWRSVRQKRADLRGASRLATVVFACSMVAWLCATNHVPTSAEFTSFTSGIGAGLLAAAVLWCLYVALEPLVRKRWPESMISWSQILAGTVRHPLVGGHLLIGVAFGVAFTLLFALPELFGVRATVQQGSLNAVVDLPRMIEVWARGVFQSFNVAMGMFFFYFLLRSLLRREWLASVVFVLFFSVVGSGSVQNYWVGAMVGAVQFGLAIFILTRFGILPMVVGIAVSIWLGAFPLTTDFTTWYAGSTMFALGSVIALAAYALYTALAGRRVFNAGLLDPA